MTRSFVVIAALASACGSASVDTHARFENDYPGARIEARQRHLPLAVEIWAPW